MTTEHESPAVRKGAARHEAGSWAALSFRAEGPPLFEPSDTNVAGKSQPEANP